MAIVQTTLISWDSKPLWARGSAMSLVGLWLLICFPTISTFAQSAEKIKQVEIVKKEYPFPVYSKEQKLINEAFAAFRLHMPAADSLKKELDKIDIVLSPVDSAAYHYAMGMHYYYSYQYDEAMQHCTRSFQLLEQENLITASQFVKTNIATLVYVSKQIEEAVSMYKEVLAHDSCPEYAIGKLNHNIGAMLFETQEAILNGDNPEEKEKVYELIDYHLSAAANNHLSRGKSLHLANTLSVWVTSKINQQQFEAAVIMIDSVIGIAERLNDPRRKAFTLIKKAQVQDQMGRPDLGVKTIEWAIHHLDSIGDFDQYLHAMSKKRASYLLLEDYQSADSVSIAMYRSHLKHFDTDLTESLSNYQAQFEKANDQLIIKEQELKLSRRNMVIYLSIAALLGAVLVFLLLYQKSKRKAEAEKSKVIAESQKQSVKAVIMAQEEERQRIAKDLHDGIVQQLGGLKLGLEKLFIHSSTSESDRLLSVLDDSADELRTISHQMMPKALIELGLIPAMEDMLDRSLVNTDISYEFEHFGIIKRWEEAVEVAIYRISQELVNNVIKHSSASEVSVQLLKSGSNAILIIEDNGKGFDSSQKQSGIGLMNITSRVDTVNGQVNFEPSPNSGTLVTIKIPIHA